MSDISITNLEESQDDIQKIEELLSDKSDVQAEQLKEEALEEEPETDY